MLDIKLLLRIRYKDCYVKEESKDNLPRGMHAMETVRLEEQEDLPKNKI